MICFVLLLCLKIAFASDYTTSFLDNYDLYPTLAPENLGAIPFCGEDELEYKFACVPYYNCDPETNTIREIPIVDGSGKIIPKGDILDPKCEDFIHVCCKLPQQLNISTVVPTLHPEPTDEEKWDNCGTYEETNSFSWLLSVYANSNEVCQGSLITPRLVLTAAHCVRNFSPQNITIKADNNVKVKVQEIFTHNSFINGPLYKDAALVLLKRPLKKEFTTKRTICLQETDRSIQISDDCFVLNPQSYINMDLVPRRECQKQLRNSTLGNYFILENTFMCTKIDADQINVASIFGGSPLLCSTGNEQNRIVQVGIASWSVDSEKVVIFTDISKLRKWIDDKVTLLGLSKVSYTL